MKISIIAVPCKDNREARIIAEKLCQNRLAFCCNIIPAIKSVYRWKSKVEKADESLLVVKTRETLKTQAIKSITKYHSFDLPDIISWEAQTSENKLDDWINRET